MVAQIAAIFSIAAGAIHVSAAGDHTNLPVMFAGFLIVATLQIALGGLLLQRRPSRLVASAGVALMVGSIAVWLISRTAGLPFLEDGHTEPVGFKDGITVLFEVASLPALVLLLSRDLARVSLPSPRLESRTLSVVGPACLALMVPALMLGGGGHHTHEQAVEMGIHEDDHGEGGADLAHAGQDDHRTRGGDDHAGRRRGSHGKPGGGHARGANGHRHSERKLASGPLHRSHGDGGHDRNGSSREHDEHDSDENGDGGHRDGEHRRGRRPDRDRGHGDHGGDEPGDESGDGPITITYEPEPSVCVAAVCFP